VSSGTLKVTAVVGARPNFVKMAPVLHALLDRDQAAIHVLHTGQHYDAALSVAFLEQLGMPTPDDNLGIGSGPHGEQTARALAGVERVLMRERPDAVIVAGDVNSTLAAALAAVKLLIPVVHVESGLRSQDWTMPEEVNRVLTDRISDLLLCTSEDAVDNLRAEGIAGDGVVLVGNTMIDSLRRMLDVADRSPALEQLGLEPRSYVLVTLHRPALVDDPRRLEAVLHVLGRIAQRLPVVFPMHPRTRAHIEKANVPVPAGLIALEPLGYLEFLSLERWARLVVTDSGGVQEETSALGVPCVTYRTTTERPVTLELGTNRLVGLDPRALATACDQELARQAAFTPAPIPLWDGHAGVRAADAIARFLAGRQGRATGAAAG
jgi:UDP-N-acetylglucosamine 2-epimerase (non-hydrolysing)